MSDEPHGVFLRVTERGTIITSTPALPDGPPQYALLHSLVGGYMEIAFHCPSPDLSAAARGRALHFYCDEDGLAKQLPYNLTLGTNHIVGPIVVTAARAPDTHGLTPFEAEAVKLFIKELAGR